ncbi:helix-turn-helix domain-containing protein [Hymenobacter sp.]|jgi:hypothetical protein|uniref:helix-turn-helix domain-containing protein n=1 Tax=Hymenobacter sp. TaxID=1898978 RepID=UPI002EDB0B2D
MQAVLIIPETEWRAVVGRLERLEAQQQAAAGPAPAPDDILTTDQAAELLGITPEAVRCARRAGRLPGVRRNEKAFGFRRSVVEAYPLRYQRPAL